MQSKKIRANEKLSDESIDYLVQNQGSGQQSR